MIVALYLAIGATPWVCVIALPELLWLLHLISEHHIYSPSR
jgi:hypothetical protein